MPKLSPGIIISERYKLVERIGSGGFSVVWLAEDIRKRNAQVALKVYAPQQGLDDSGKKMFEEEYHFSQTLNDSRLLKATDYFFYEDSPCLIFPYMQGGPLNETIQQHGRLEEKEIAKMIYQTAGALNYLHSHSPEPVLHLDIKPENILSDYKGDYVLSDFGISQPMRHTLMRGSNVKGENQIYKAPERILNQPFGTKVDIFAFGITILECCNGLMDGNLMIGYNLAGGISQLPGIDHQVYTKRLEELIHACLQANPDARPTAAKLASYARHYTEKQFWPDIDELSPGKAAPPPPKPKPTGRETRPTTPKKEPVAAPPPKPRPEPIAATSPTPPKGGKKIVLASVLSIFLLAAGFGGWQYNKSRQYENCLAQAEKDWTAGDYQAAYNQINAALSYYPGDERALSMKLGLESEAESNFDKLKQLVTKNLPKKKYGLLLDSLQQYQWLSYIIPGAFNTYKAEEIEFPIFRDSAIIYNKVNDYEQSLTYIDRALSKKQDAVLVNLRAEVEKKANAQRLSEINKSLFTACKNGDLTALEQALSEGADVNAKEGKSSAILWAIKSGSLDIVKRLAEAGAKCDDNTSYITVNEETFGSPAVLAAGTGKMEILKYLIEIAKVPLNQQEYYPESGKSDGWTALLAAASNEQLAALDYLIKRGADLNKPDGYGATPLMEACATGNYNIVNKLIEAGANLFAEDSDGSDAYDYADDESIKSLLRRYGAGKFYYKNEFYYEDGNFEDSYSSNADWTVSGGYYYGDAKQTGIHSYADYFDIDTEADLEFSTSVLQTSGGTSGSFGITAFGSNNSKYYFMITPAGYYSVFYYENGVKNTLKQDTYTSAINSVSSYYNKLQVRKSGSQVAFLINNNQLYSFYIPDIFGSKFGFCIQGDPNVKYDYIELKGSKG